MTGIGNQFGVRDFRFFFDRPQVINALEKAERRVLSRTGAYGRLAMRHSFKKGKKRGDPEPGKPPRYHVHPNAGLRTVLYAFDPARGSVIIGPLLYGGSKWTEWAWGRRLSFEDMGGRTVPQLLDEGGEKLKTIQYKSGHTYSRTMTYRAFPFRQSALEKTHAKMQQYLRDSL